MERLRQKQTNIKRIIARLARKYDIPHKEVYKAVFFQFKFVFDMVKASVYNDVRLPYFGKFFVKNKTIKHLMEVKKKQEEEEKLAIEKARKAREEFMKRYNEENQ